MATFVKYNCFTKDLAEKKHDFSADAFKIALTNTAPNVATHAVLADITEIAATNGYPAGGNAASINSSSQAGGVYKSVLSDPAVFQASGGSMAAFRYAVLYNTSGNRLIAYWDYGSSVTLAVSETFTVDFDQVNGIFTVT